APPHTGAAPAPGRAAPQAAGSGPRRTRRGWSRSAAPGLASRRPRSGRRPDRSGWPAAGVPGAGSRPGPPNRPTWPDRQGGKSSPDWTRSHGRGGSCRFIAPKLADQVKTAGDRAPGAAETFGDLVGGVAFHPIESNLPKLLVL